VRALYRALYLPGPAYHDAHVKETAGWWHILAYQREAIEQAGYDVVVPEVPAGYIDYASSFSQIASYSLYVSQFLDSYVDLVVASPSYGHHTIFKKGPVTPKVVTYCWNQSDRFRDKQVKPEYE